MFLEKFYLKFPALNNELKDFLVKVLPFLSLFFGVLLTFAAVIDFFGTPILSAFSKSGGSDIVRGLLLGNTLGVIQGVMMVFAFQGLRGRKLNGWRLFFLAQIVWIIESLFTLSPWFLFSLVLFYPLFQVKSKYK